LKILIPIIWQIICFLGLKKNCTIYPTKIAKLKKFETKKNMLVGGGGFTPTISTKNFTKLNCVYFYKQKCKIFLHH
jgi:hypothetical protein